MKNVHKLGTSRAGELSRLWLEGPRLVEAGFTHKLGFKRTVSENKLTLEIVTDARMGKVAALCQGHGRRFTQAPDH
jgi:hypothetical protein